jgi:hypothetical protein
MRLYAVMRSSTRGSVADVSRVRSIEGLEATTGANKGCNDAAYCAAAIYQAAQIRAACWRQRSSAAS